MRTHLHVVLLAAAATFLAGCGGSTQSAATRAGSISFTVKWPVKSRLIPYDSASIVAVVTDSKNNVLATKTVPRPPEGTLTTSVTYPNLPAETVTLTASGHPNSDGTGVAQAIGSEPVTILAGQSVPVTVTMADTIVSLLISANGVFYTPTGSSIPIDTGSHLQLAETAYDKSGDIVLTDTHTIQWAIANGNATITSLGLLTGVSPGSDVVTVTETESGVSTTAKVAISNPPADMFPGLALVDSSGTHLYVQETGAIHVFDIAANGQLTFVQEIAATNVNTTQTPYVYNPFILTPDGLHLYAYGYAPTTPNPNPVINEYNVQSDGTLVSAGAPIAAQVSIYSFAYDPTGQFLYADGPLGANGSIDVYSIASSGVLTLSTTISFLYPATPYGLGNIPGTQYLFGNTENESDGFYLMELATGPNGTLSVHSDTAIPESDVFPYRAQPPYLFNPSGNFLVTFNDYAIAPFTISAAGAIATAPAYDLPTSDTMPAGAISPSGKYLYVRGYGRFGDSKIYPFDISGNSLVALPTTGTGLPVESLGSVVITPNGQYVYTTNAQDGSISEFSTNADGSLTPLSPAKVTDQG